MRRLFPARSAEALRHMASSSLVILPLCLYGERNPSESTSECNIFQRARDSMTGALHHLLGLAYGSLADPGGIK